MNSLRTHGLVILVVISPIFNLENLCVVYYKLYLNYLHYVTLQNLVRCVQNSSAKRTIRET